MKLPSIATSRKTLGDSVYDVIREAITSLRLEPGQMIYENELASSFGVSRTPIREAFRLLVAEELLEILPQRGARIAYISKKKVEEARFVRASLEASAFAKAASLWDPEEKRCRKVRDEVLELLERQKQAAERGDHLEFLELDEAFHQAILSLADNATLLSIIHQMRAHVNRFRLLELQEVKHAAEVIRDHESIFEAIAGKDAGEAEKRLLRHLRRLEGDFPKVISKYAHYFKMD